MERLEMNLETGELSVIPLTDEEIEALKEANPGWIPEEQPSTGR